LEPPKELKIIINEMSNLLAKVADLSDKNRHFGAKDMMGRVVKNLEDKLRDKMFHMGGSHECSSKAYLEPMKHEARFLEVLISEFKDWCNRLP